MVCWPVFEKQSPENIGSVLRSYLVRDDHRLHHKMNDAGQSVLLQVQEDGAYEERGGGYKKMRSHIQHSGRYRLPIVCFFDYRDYLVDGIGEIGKNHKTGWRCEHICLAVAKLPCVMVRRSSSKLRKESEATWGLPQRSVSSSTSSSNLIQRARSFQRISWSFSTISSFSSTNTCRRSSTDILYIYIYISLFIHI